MNKTGLFCLVTAAIVLFSGCTKGEDQAVDNKKSEVPFKEELVMKIDDREVMKSEYMVYLYTTTKSFLAVGGDQIWTMDFDGQSADQLVEERTMNTLQGVIAAEQYAKENNMALTDTQKEEIKQGAEEFILQVPEEDLNKMGVDKEKMIPFLEGSYLYSLVYQTLAAEYEVNPDEALAYYEENKETLAEDATFLELDSILVDSKEIADDIVKRARAGEDFKKLFMEFDVEDAAKNTEDGGKLSLYRNQFKMSFGVEEMPVANKIMEPVAIEDKYMIFKVESVTAPTEEEVKELAQAMYSSQKQTAYSEERLKEMIAAQKVKKNDNVYNNLEKFHE